MSIPTSGESTVDLAERALRAFGDLTREQAAAVLPFWRYYHDLDDAQAAAVLVRFPSRRARGHQRRTEPGNSAFGWWQA